MKHLLRILAVACVLLCAAAGPAWAQIDQARLDKALATVLTWKYGDDAGDLQFLGQAVVEAGNDKALRGKMEAKILAALGKTRSNAGKDFLCRQLVIVGGAKSVAPLAGLLGDKDVSHIARYALARIPGPRADRALLEALRKVDDSLKVGMAHSLGQRGVVSAVDDIIPLLDSKNEDLVDAALRSLGQLGTDKAAAAVVKARKAVTSKRLARTAVNACLDCAAALSRAGKAEKAMAIYQELHAPGEPAVARIAALKGMAKLQPDRAMPLAVAALADKDAKVRQAAIPTLRDVPGQAGTKAICALLPTQNAPAQQLLLLVLIDRGDASALPAVTKALDSPDADVRAAALQAAGKLGDASVAPTLVQRAARAAGGEQTVARTALDMMTGPGVNAAIAGCAASADAKVRAEALRCLGARQATDSAEAVLKAIDDTDPAVRASALRALRDVAGAEQSGAIVAALVQATDAGPRDELERAAVVAGKKIPPADKPASAALAAYAKATAPEGKASLVRVLGRIGDDDALPCLTRATKDDSADVQSEAIRALSAWPTGKPLGTLRAIAKDPSAGETQRVLALRGWVDLIAKETTRSDEGILAMYADALASATRTQEKQLVLSRLGAIRHEGALAIVDKCLSDPALKAVAQQAAGRIKKLLAAPASVTASINSQNAKNAVDGNAGTRWDTGGAMKGGEWFSVDLGRQKRIRGLVLDCTGSPNDHPREYEVYVSANTLGKGALVVKGKGTPRVTTVKFPKPVVGRKITIVQTGRTDGLFWSIHQLTVQSDPVK